MRAPIALVLLCATLAPAAAHAQEAGRLLAIQQRKYQVGHELELAGVFEPQDAFSKGLGAEAAYTWHFADSWGWEVLRGSWLAQLDSGLKDQLLTEFGVKPTQFNSLEYCLSSALTWTPLYGKFALRNASLVHAEAFLDVGAALGHFSSGWARGPEVGVGLRVFLSEALSLRFDVRDAVFIHARTNGSITTQVIFLSLGLSISLGGSGG